MISRCLLLVDPDPAVHEFVATALKQQDLSIQDVSNGSDALDRLREKGFDLVMAGAAARNGCDSIELLRKVRQMRPGARVILTGEDSNPAHVLRAISEHAYSYLHKPLTAGPVADVVQQALNADSWQEDIEVLSARPEWTEIRIRCTLAAAERAAHLLRETEIDLPAGVREDVAAAIRELLFNAVEHGGRTDPANFVRVSLVRTLRSLVVTVQDPGAGFSLDLLPHAAICNPDDSPTRHVQVRAEKGQRPGGFGILMTRCLVDELVYNEAGNQVMFVKYL